VISATILLMIPTLPLRAPLRLRLLDIIDYERVDQVAQFKGLIRAIKRRPNK
jgi:hypothetical protein